MCHITKETSAFCNQYNQQYINAIFNIFQKANLVSYWDNSKMRILAKHINYYNTGMHRSG